MEKSDYIKYLETFKNQYGESWWFNYDKIHNMGIIWSNDSLIYNDKFYVFDGICPTLILNKEEENWLLETWTKYSIPTNNYLNLDIAYRNNAKGTFLNNYYCPICLQKQEDFEWHHCIEVSKGGSDDIENVLLICNSCHALTTNGCKNDREPRHIAAINHQKCIYGIKFYLMNPLNSSRNKNQDIGLYKNYPHFKEIIDNYDSFNNEQKIEYDYKIKKESLYYYKYNRGIVMNFIKK